MGQASSDTRKPRLADPGLTPGRLGHSYPLTSDPCAEGSQGQGCLPHSACAQHLFPDSGAGATAKFPHCLLDPVWKFSLFSVPSSQLLDA